MFIVWLLPVAHVLNCKPVVKLPCNLEKKNLLLFLELSSTDTPLPAAVDTPFGSECLQSVYLVNDRFTHTHDVCLALHAHIVVLVVTVKACECGLCVCTWHSSSTCHYTTCVKYLKGETIYY